MKFCHVLVGSNTGRRIKKGKGLCNFKWGSQASLRGDISAKTWKRSERESEVHLWGKSTPSSCKGEYKGPEAGVF